jgi:hypothetical protein
MGVASRPGFEWAGGVEGEEGCEGVDEVVRKALIFAGMDVDERCVNALRGFIEDKMADEYQRGLSDGLYEGDQQGYGRGFDAGYDNGAEAGCGSDG